MNQIFSVVLAIVMALTGLVGNLSANNVAQPVSAEISITKLEGDLSSMISTSGSVQMTPEILEVITKLLSALSLKISSDTTVGRLDVSANGLPVANLAVKHREGGWDVVSSLFAKSLLTVEDSTMSMFSATSDSGISLSTFSSVDPAALAAVPAAIESVIAGFAEKEGEPETGTFTVAEKEYTTKIPVNVTTKEAGILVLTAVRDLLNDETFAPLAAQLGNDFNAESIENSLAELQEKDDADLAETAIAKYVNDAGDSAIEMLIKQDEQQVTLVYAQSGKKTDISIQALGIAEAYISIDQELQAIGAAISIAQNGQKVDLVLSSVTAENGTTIEAELSFQGIVLGIKAVISSEQPVFEAAEDLKVVAMEDLMKDEEAYNAFNTELTQGLMTASVSLLTVAPELMTLLMPSTGTGQDAVVEEAPTEEAVVVEETP